MTSYQLAFGAVLYPLNDAVLYPTLFQGLPEHPPRLAVQERLFVFVRYHELGDGACPCNARPHSALDPPKAAGNGQLPLPLAAAKQRLLPADAGALLLPAGPFPHVLPSRPS